VTKISGGRHFVNLLSTKSCLRRFAYFSEVCFHTTFQPATFLLYHHIGCVFLFRCVLEFRCGWVGVVSVWQAEAQTPDDGCINVRNMLSIEEVK